MRFLSRVVWSEGMYLGPHQFQVQSRYFEDSLDFAISALWFKNFGLAGCKLDPEALRNGALSVVHARGLFPDGTAFHIPDCDALPKPRNIAAAFPPTQDSLGVFLTLPERRSQGPNCAMTGAANGTRYMAETRTFHDEVTGSDERPVRVGRKNIQLRLHTEEAPGLVSLPIARVRRDGAGHFAFDQEFVPPCVQITASESLMLLLRRLIEILEEKSATLGRKSASSTDFSSREIANFWLLHAVNSALAPLRHHWISKRGHPEEVFLELSRLAGALCTFALDSSPAALPEYDHLRLGEGFTALDRHIRAHLETIVPTNCIGIPLSKVGQYFYEGDISDTRCFGRSRWILGIHSSAGEVEVIERTPQLVKICSSKFVGELVKRALPGLVLKHLPVPPPAVPAKLEYHYFAIAKDGPLWDHLVQTKRVGVYVPGELPSPELDLLVVLDR